MEGIRETMVRAGGGGEPARKVEESPGPAQEDAAKFTRLANAGKDVRAEGAPRGRNGEKLDMFSLLGSAAKRVASEKMAGMDVSERAAGECAVSLAAGFISSVSVEGKPGPETPAGLEPAKCAELVERILASEPAADGTAEVRLKVDASILPDTEIKLMQSPEKGLLVEFRSESPDSQRLLMPNLPELRERLSERTEGRVTVTMSESTDSRDAPGGDGRSRNRRNLFEEYAER